ncbi:MAG: hypothetical protein ACYCOY_06170 [Metallibacterium sp.]
MRLIARRRRRRATRSAARSVSDAHDRAGALRYREQRITRREHGHRAD